MTRRLPLFLAATVLTLGAGGALAAARHHTAATDEQIAAALADASRADQADDDARRQAAAVIAFSGVGPGDRVVDYLPGSGYWTRIFTTLVGPSGHVDALWPQAFASHAKSLPGLQARNMANVTLAVQPTNLPTVTQPVDLFWTVQNYHDIPAAMIGAFNQAVFKALKPGGTYLIVDHADAAGATRTTPFKHRIDPAVVRAQVTGIGFMFDGASDVLANPDDDHSKPVFDPAVRGHTDQFVFKFHKPG